MKHWRVIAISFLALAPLALFAAIDQYENPLGCGITSLPQFIKGVLTIIVKVGIPVATIFIIWSGFLFLTAQGDEAQLTKAKKSFVWACIGTAVLLGAWLLATAINATIQSIGGGTNGSAGTTVDAGCGSGGGQPPPATLGTVPPIPPHETQKESASVACTGGGGMTGSWVMENAFKQYWEYFSWVSRRPLGTADIDVGTVRTGGPEDCLYEKGVFMTKIQANQVSNEQGWFYVIGTDGKNQWKSVGQGTNNQLLTSPEDYRQVLRNGALGIVDFHTHPQGGLKNNKGQSIPSSADIFYVAGTNSFFGASVISRVSDSAIDLSRPDAPYTVWTYGATNASPFISLTTTGISDGWDTFLNGVIDLGNHQQDQNAFKFVTDFNAASNVKTDTNAWVNAAWSSLVAAGSGSYGTTIQNMAKDYAQKIANTPLYAWWDTYRTCTNGEDATNKMLEIYRSNGVTVTEEQHPYLSCLTSP